MNYVARYFNLADSFPFKTTTTSPGTTAPVGTTPQPMPKSGTPQSGVTWQVATYLLVLVSIVASRFCDLYRAGALSSFRLDAPYLLFLGIVSLIAFPVVYTKAALSQGDPVLVRIALIFTAGMGWEKIVATAIGK